MKKVLIAALAAIAVLTGGTARAQQSVGTLVRYDQIHFITSAAANPNGGGVDSLVARRVGAAGASSVLDTTAAIGTLGWMRQLHTLNGGATDTSAVWATLLVYANLAGGDDGCESGADSLAVAMQVSVDGVTWATTAAVAGQSASGGTAPIATRNNQTILAGVYKDALSLNGASVANGQPLWVFKYRIRGINQVANIDCDNVFDFPYIRFVLSFHDAKGYKVAAKIGHFSGIQP